MPRLARRLVLLGGIAILALGGFAYMASNSVGASYAGQGTGPISGYTVSNISYSNGLAALPTTKPGDSQNGITEVSFTLSPDNANFTAVDLYNSGGTLVGGGGANNCTETTGTWTCNVTALDGTSPIPVTDVAYIDVEAVH